MKICYKIINIYRRFIKILTIHRWGKDPLPRTKQYFEQAPFLPRFSHKAIHIRSVHTPYNHESNYCRPKNVEVLIQIDRFDIISHRRAPTAWDTAYLFEPINNWAKKQGQTAGNAFLFVSRHENWPPQGAAAKIRAVYWGILSFLRGRAVILDRVFSSNYATRSKNACSVFPSFCFSLFSWKIGKRSSSRMIAQIVS